ncbi:hypothetical protein D3C87_1504120 [compost metagenome]
MTDRHEPIRYDGADQLIHLTAQRLRRLDRPHRHGDDDARRRLQTHRLDRRHHRGACRQAVIDQDHHLILELHRRASSPIRLLTSQQLPAFPCHHTIEGGLINRVRPQRVVVEDLNTAAGNGAHGELLIGGSAQLAHQHQVQAHLQGSGHFISHRHPATGQGEDDDIGSERVFEQRFHQTSTGCGAVLQDEWR